LLVVVAGRVRQGVDHGDRRVDGGVVMRGRDRQAHCGVAVLRITHHARDIAQHACGRIEIVDRRQSPLLAGAGRPLEQIVENQIEDAERIVSSRGFHGAREGQQRRDPALGGHLTQGLRAAHHRVASQRPQSAGRDAREVECADAEGADLFQPLERRDEGDGTGARGAVPQAIERRPMVVVGDLQQLLQGGALRRRGQSGEVPPEPRGRPLAHPGNQPGQRAEAREHHLARDQARHRKIEQCTGPLGADPRPRVEPAYEAKILRLVGEVAIAIALADQRGVVPACLRDAVALQTGAIGDPELPCQRRHDARWHGTRVLKEGAQGAHRDQLDGEANLRVITAALRDEGAVGIVEVEDASEIDRRRLADVSTIGVGPVVGEKVDRHQ